MSRTLPILSVYGHALLREWGGGDWRRGNYGAPDWLGGCRLLLTSAAGFWEIQRCRRCQTADRGGHGAPSVGSLFCQSVPRCSNKEALCRQGRRLNRCAGLQTVPSRRAFGERANSAALASVFPSAQTNLREELPLSSQTGACKCNQP